jgi:hypothetical protein
MLSNVLHAVSEASAIKQATRTGVEAPVSERERVTLDISKGSLRRGAASGNRVKTAGKGWERAVPARAGVRD